MALGHEASKAKYKDYIKAARELGDHLKASGYTVKVEDDIELGATYVISLQDNSVAKLTWNIPYYLEFESFVDQEEESFEVDYVKSLNDWKEFLHDIYVSLENYSGS